MKLTSVQSTPKRNEQKHQNEFVDNAIDHTAADIADWSICFRHNHRIQSMYGEQAWRMNDGVLVLGTIARNSDHRFLDALEIRGEDRARRNRGTAMARIHPATMAIRSIRGTTMADNVRSEIQVT